MWHAFIVFASAVVTTFPFLGFSGFALGEGACTYRGWEAISTGEWVVPRLFGQLDLRAGPLVAWLQGVAAWMFGQREFVARSVSGGAVVVASLVSFGFAQRWFGRPWGLVAGLAYAIMPLVCGAFEHLSGGVAGGRTAAVEPVLHCFTVLTVCLMIDRVLGPRRKTALGGLGVAWGLAFAFAGMLLCDGLAGVPVVVAVIAGVFIATRVVFMALWPGTILALTAGALAYGVWLMSVKEAQARAPAAVMPEAAAHVIHWTKVLLLPEIAAVVGLPHALAMVWLPWKPGPRIAMNLRDERTAGHTRAIACTLAWSVAVAVIVFMAMGGQSARDVSPVLVLLPLCVSAAGERCWGVAARARTAPYRRVAKRAVGAFIALALLAFGVAGFGEFRRATRTSGREDAVRLGDVLQGGRGDHVELWGDEIVQKHPEVLRYACDRAFERGEFVTPRWVRGESASMVLPPSGSYLVVGVTPTLDWRWDEGAAVLVFEGKAHNTAYRVYRIP